MLELREFCEVCSGVAVRQTPNGNARFLQLSDLSELRAGRSPNLAAGDRPYVARAHSIDEGDVIIGARGEVTDVYVSDKAVAGAFISLDLYLVRPDRRIVDPHFLAAFLDLPSTQAALATGKQGSALARLPKDALERLEVPLPAKDRQRLIAGLSRVFQSECELLRRLFNLNETLGRETIARAIAASATVDPVQRKGSAQ